METTTLSAPSRGKLPVLVVSIIVLVLIAAGAYYYLHGRSAVTSGGRVKVAPELVAAAPKGKLIDPSLSPFIFTGVSNNIESSKQTTQAFGKTVTINSATFTVMQPITTVYHAYANLLKTLGYTIQKENTTKTEINILAAKSATESVAINLLYVNELQTKVGVFLNKSN